MAKVIDHIKNAKSTLFSLEILPPSTGESIQKLFNNVAPLMEFKPKFIDVTYHREEYVFKKMPNGLLEQKSIRKRPGTVSICAALMHKFDVDTVPHIICGGFTKEETEYALIDLNFLGIDNVLALRGDCIKGQKTFEPSFGGHSYADELVSQIHSMNKGDYLSDELQNPTPTKFCIGVAGYPEKHYESPNLKTDLKYLKKKIENGADYVVTQMFFDNRKYFDFVDKCKAEGITVPIIPGLKPITTKSQISNLPRNFFIDMPEDLIDALENCRTDDDVKNVGVEWAINQSRELIKNKVPCLHFYSMGKSTSIQQIAAQLY
ncbi:MAG TPA: methylenetetrahydrofolate reductase [NAD(P)H] [Bacteriovoracaceae bacterium]|nr:methylenetetrahydrofolate reductase [NAD(P)H] [Bacteriovoracaceae bacterium]